MAGTKTPLGEGEAPAAPPQAHFGYRPALDGLRTVAVYLVVAFHAGVGRFAGGFIGVDLFFVLSGFLVTSVMLTEYDSGGRIDLARFYARRIRRLLPAAVLAIVAIAVASLFLDPPLARSGFVSAARSSLLYYSNWHFIGAKTDYFAADANENPYLHFWSLSVEEQFYAAFPIVLVALLFAARGRRSAVAWGLVSVTAVLVVVQLFWADRNPVRAYYGTDARTYQMAAGAALAIAVTVPAVRKAVTAVSRVVPAIAAACGLALLLFVASDAVDISPSRRGLLAAAAAVAVIASFEVAGGPVGWLLSRSTMVELGRVSYGTYLWHWPVIIYLRRVVDLDAGALTVAAAVIATAMAFLSSTLLEMPIRTSPRLVRRAPQVVATGLMASAVIALAVVPPILRNERLPVVTAAGRPAGTLPAPGTTAPPAPPPTSVGTAAATSPTTIPTPTVATTAALAPTTVAETVPADLDLAAAASFATGMFDCVDGAPDECILEHGDGPHVFVIGDSNAAMLMPMFRQLALDHGFTLSATTAPGCTWQIGLAWVVEDQTLVDDCERIRNDAYDRVIPALAPDIVIGVHIPRDDPARGLGSPFVPIGESLGDGIEGISALTRATLDRIEAAGIEMVVVEPLPYTTFDTVQCLSGTRIVMDCAFAATVEPTPMEQLYRAEADARPGVASVDLDPIVCPGKPLCVPILNGELVYRDAFHVYPPFAVDHRDEIWALLVETGAFD